MRGPSNPRMTQIMKKGRTLSLPLLAVRQLGGVSVLSNFWIGCATLTVLVFCF
jgi:hypothetical protein